MNQITLLWEIQNYEEKMEEIVQNKILETRKNKINGLKKEHQCTKNDLCKRIEEFKELDSFLIKENLQNKEMNFKIKELEKEIYSGSVDNFKVYENLEKELNGLKEENDALEEKIINNIDKKEELKNNIIKMKNKIRKIETKYKAEKNNYYEEKENLKIQKEQCKAQIKKLYKKIDEASLELYTKTKSRIIPPISKIGRDSCSGCNMMISVILLNEINKNNRIYSCENCGRILYVESTF